MRNWLLLAAAIVAVDQMTKYAVVQHFTANPPLVVAPFLNLVLVYNTGAAFIFSPTRPAGLGTLGNLGAMPFYAHNDSLSFGDNLTKVTSTHTIKLGVFVERGRKQQNGGSFPQGQFGLAAPRTPGGTGNDYGDLLVGRVAQYFQDSGVPRGEWQFWNVEGFAQDSWKALRNLTVEAGLRVAWMPNNEERNGLGTRLEPSAYDPTQGAYVDGDLARPNGVLVASRGEIPRLFAPLMAFGRKKGAESIPELLDLKRQLMRRRGAGQVRRHEKVNWAIRLLRSGRDIPLEQVADVH